MLMGNKQSKQPSPSHVFAYVGSASQSEQAMLFTVEKCCAAACGVRHAHLHVLLLEGDGLGGLALIAQPLRRRLLKRVVISPVRYQLAAARTSAP